MKQESTKGQFAEMNSCQVAYADYLCVLSGRCVTALYCLFSILCTTFLTGSVVVTPRKSQFLPGSRIKSQRVWQAFGPGSVSLLLCTGEALAGGTVFPQPVNEVFQQIKAEISCNWESWLVMKGVQAPLGPRCPFSEPDGLQQKC